MRTGKSPTLFLAFIMALISLLLSSGTAMAESIGLSVRPAKLEIQAIPGTKEIKTISIANVSDQELDVKVAVRDFEITPDNILNYYPPGDISYSAARWIDLDKNVFSLKPKQFQDLNLALVAPKNVEPGGHYASITFGAAPGARAG